jgi:prepilin-type N-terminal cleavage/methylation domain-containing protein
MVRRLGFTLLELLIALVVTAVAVTIAGSALRTASIAGARVEAHRDTLEHDARLRATLTDMLRHAPSAESVEEPLLQIDQDAAGGERLTFLSKGVRPPYGTGDTWRVTVSVSAAGLTLDARPIGASLDATALHSVHPSVTTLSIRVLEQATPQATSQAGTVATAGWRRDWPLNTSRPAMIAFDFGQGAKPPLIVALDPLATVAVLR